MVSHEFSAEIKQLAKEFPILLIQQSFNEAIFELAVLEHLYLIIAATDNKEINQQVFGERECSKKYSRYC